MAYILHSEGGVTQSASSNCNEIYVIFKHDKK